MTTVLNTSLYLPFGKREVTRAAAEASIIQDLLCYDTVFLYTDQMEAVGVLTAFMGAEVLTDALERGAVRFVYDRHILGWSKKRPGRMSVTPVFAIGSMETGQNNVRTGFTQLDPAVAAMMGLRGFAIPEPTVNRLLDAVTKATVEMAWPNATEEAKLTSQEATIRDLRVYREAVMELPNFPVKVAEINRAIREVKNPKRRKSETYHVTKVESHTGPALLDEQKPLPVKELGMLNLVLANRFLVAHASAGASATLHTEPIVEQILAARLAAIRKAAAGELDTVLKAEEVYLPVLASAGEFPYRELIDAREMRAGQEFRSVVRDRDESGAELLQAYMRTINGGLSSRFTVQVGRWLVGVVAGVFSPITAAMLSAGDVFLVDRVLRKGDARYFVDDTLRRIASGGVVRRRIRSK